jgi:hypothetical protein
MGPRGTWLLGAFLAALALNFHAAAAPSVALRLPDLDGRLVDPFDAPAATKAIVFVFVSVDCPISNRYAPEIQRLHQTFASRGVALRIVYPNPAELPAAIRAHMKDYSLPAPALRDPKQELAKLASATITPEAAVYDPQGRRLYLGRIDDRYVSLGVQRPVATQHDLEEALLSTLAGRGVAQARTPAVGCFIADFAR